MRHWPGRHRSVVIIIAVIGSERAARSEILLSAGRDYER
jgi:hypothetical protein